MHDEKIPKILHVLAGKLPKFPDGRIDYSTSKTAVIVTIFVKFRGKILLLKRSEKVGSHRNKWHTAAGYVDELKPIEEKIFEELKEELSINKKSVSSLFLGKPYKFKDMRAKKTWFVNPALVELKKKPVIKLDWEHTELKWVTLEQIRDFDVVPSFFESLKRVIRADAAAGI